MERIRMNDTSAILERLDRFLCYYETITAAAGQDSDTGPSACRAGVGAGAGDGDGDGDQPATPAGAGRPQPQTLPETLDQIARLACSVDTLAGWIATIDARFSIVLDGITGSFPTSPALCAAPNAGVIAELFHPTDGSIR